MPCEVKFLHSGTDDSRSSRSKAGLRNLPGLIGFQSRMKRSGTTEASETVSSSAPPSDYELFAPTKRSASHNERASAVITKKTTIHPVVHVESVEQVHADVAVLREFPVGTIFLIDHDSNDERLLSAVAEVVGRFPGLPVGLNFMRRSAGESLVLLAERFDGTVPVADIWADTAGIEAGRGKELANRLEVLRQETGWAGRQFGGVAFKYQAPVAPEDLQHVAAEAARYIDIPTTSGAGTGKEPDLAKLQAMRAGLGNAPLAIASGVTAENVSRFTPYVDHILVATGINNAHGRVDPQRLASLLANIDAGADIPS